MPDQTNAKEAIWTEVNIAPRGKSWLYGKLIDGIHGYKTRQGMENGERDHHRVSPEGRAIGIQLVRLVEPVIKHLEAHGDADERCKSCAFRAGTVPNGCLQTMMDAVKAMSEQKPFLCHVEHYANGKNKLCAGWLATQWGTADKKPVACSWEFSPPDEPDEAARSSAAQNKGE